MGGQCCGNSEVFLLNYNETDREEEFYIRRYEQQKFKAMTKDFAFIKSILRLNNNNMVAITIIENILLKEFDNNDLYTLIKASNYFEVKKGFYSVPKLKILAFLICKTEKSTLKNKEYYDKSIFLTQEILQEVEDALNDDIEYSNKHLIRLIEYMVEITLEVITKYYLNVNAITLNTYFDELIKTPHKKIIDALIKELSTNKKVRMKNIEIKPLNLFDKKINTTETGNNDQFNSISNYTSENTIDFSFRSFGDSSEIPNPNHKMQVNSLSEKKEKTDIAFSSGLIIKDYLKSNTEIKTPSFKENFGFFNSSETIKNDDNDELRLTIKSAKENLCGTKKPDQFRNVLAFNFLDLNKKFANNNFFLSSGYIRELTYHLNNTANRKFRIKDK